MRTFAKTFLLFFLLLAGLPVVASAQSAFRIVVFGDSLTSGYQLPEAEAYPAKLAGRLRDIGYQNVEVLNMSSSGRTSSVAVQEIESVLSKRPDIVIVQLGHNDALRGVNPDVVYKNLIDIIGKLQQNRVYVILFGVKAPEAMNSVYIRQLEAVYQRLVDFYRVAFLPDALAGIAGNASLNLADGVHPNGKGIDVMIDNSYLLVDGALRARWQHINDQRGYQPEVKEALPPPMPSLVVPHGNAPTAGR
jgi:acyl-CoA thioesterase-1